MSTKANSNRGGILQTSSLPAKTALIFVTEAARTSSNDSGVTSYDAPSLTRMLFDSKRCFRQQEVFPITRGSPMQNFSAVGQLRRLKETKMRQNRDLGLDPGLNSLEYEQFCSLHPYLVQ